MSHVRTQIRDEIVSRVTSCVIVGRNVFASRVYPLDESKLPGVCVYTENEEIDEDRGKQSSMQHRSVEVVLEGHDKLTAGVDDQLDAIAAEIETAVFSDRTLGGLAFAVDLDNTEVEIDAETEELIGVIKLTFRVLYLTTEGAPGTAL